jgi:phytoene/squalene synthetase
LDNFERDYNEALNNGISMNPMLHSFVKTVKRYNIPLHLISSFLKSMRADINKQVYFNNEEIKEYIYGSADVVGLMCLIVFVNGDNDKYQELREPAMKLGSAFQKVNFLRDIKNDRKILGRIYFPEFANNQFDNSSKKLIEQSIEKDFNEAWIGVKQLPGKVKFAVALSYFYYNTLFKKIKQISPEQLLSQRVRISNFKKYLILLRVGFMYKTKFI